MRGSAPGDWMVVEADESDGTFLKLPADVAIVTNIDAEHLDHFKTFAAVQEAFRAFIENVPFYGFAVMCTDHPIVQRAGRPHRGPPHHHLWREPAGRRAAGRSRQRRRPARTSRCCSATAPARPCTPSTISCCRCRAATTRSTPRRRSRSRTSSAISGRRDPQGAGRLRRREAALHPHRRMERRHDHRRLRPPSGGDRRRAARPRAKSTKGQVIAVVQPHRYTRLQSLFEPFSTCFNDADAVIVAEVYPAGEAPIEGIDRDHLVAAAARARPPPGDPAAGAAAARRHREGAREARRLRGLPRRRQHHAMGLCAAGRIEGARRMSFPDIVPALKAKAPQVRGRLLPNQSLAELTWFRVGGPAQVLFMPEDEADLAYFLGSASRRHSGHRGRPRLEPDRARRRHSGRGGPARPRLQRRQGRRAADHRRARGARREGRARGAGGRDRRACRSCAAFRARSAARCA